MRHVWNNARELERANHLLDGVAFLEAVQLALSNHRADVRLQLWDPVAGAPSPTLGGVELQLHGVTRVDIDVRGTSLPPGLAEMAGPEWVTFAAGWFRQQLQYEWTLFGGLGDVAAPAPTWSWQGGAAPPWTIHLLLEWPGAPAAWALTLGFEDLGLQSWGGRFADMRALLDAVAAVSAS